jgi:hypothetical protein
LSDQLAIKLEGSYNGYGAMNTVTGFLRVVGSLGIAFINGIAGGFPCFVRKTHLVITEMPKEPGKYLLFYYR